MKVLLIVAVLVSFTQNVHAQEQTQAIQEGLITKLI